MGNSLLGIPGIIKRKRGICYREGKASYMKDWESEKEVRLKVAIIPQSIKVLNFRRVAIQLKQSAFNELSIKFSPYMDKKVKMERIESIKELLPDSYIYEID